VLFRGSPLSNAAAERSDGITPLKEEDLPRFITDEDGVATIPIAGAGPHILAVDYKVAPSKTPDLAEADRYTATFSFTIGERK
jgi:nickel transport protein